VLRTALTSRSSACGRLNSTSLSRFASVRHPWRPALVFGPPVRRFQRGPGHRGVSHSFRKIPTADGKSPGGGAAAPVRATQSASLRHRARKSRVAA